MKAATFESTIAGRPQSDRIGTMLPNWWNWRQTRFCPRTGVAALQQKTRTIPIVFVQVAIHCRRLRRKPGASGR